MAAKTYLAVDLGAESGRVMAGRFDGARIELEQMHRFPNGPVRLGGTLRWNLIGLWSEIQNGLREAQSKIGQTAVSVGVDTWGVDFVLMNRNDELLGQPWNYRDSRTDGMLQKAFQRVPNQRSLLKQVCSLCRSIPSISCWPCANGIRNSFLRRRDCC